MAEKETITQAPKQIDHERMHQDRPDHTQVDANHENSNEGSHESGAALDASTLDASILAGQLINAEVQLALTAQGGDQAMLGTLTKQVGWRQVGRDLELFTEQGTGREAISKMITDSLAMKHEQAPMHDEGHNGAEGDDASSASAVPKMGSGIQNSQPTSQSAIDAGDPLALGHALHGIARGDVPVRFS